jgi:HPt (histidine-containing phosphotransfer) domain-containing protein
LCWQKRTYKWQKNNLALAKSHQEEKAFAATKACNQMEDCNSNLLESHQQFETLLAKMQNATCENKKELQHKIETRKAF